MIRINLLGQIRPKASRRAPSTVDAGGALAAVFIGAGLVLGALVLGFFYYTWQNQLNKENAEIKRLTAQKTDLEQTKLQVEAFEKQKAVLQLRVNTIEQLQRDRTGGQELLGLLEFRLLDLQRLDLVVFFGELFFPSVVEKPENEYSHQHAGTDKRHWHGSAGVHRHRRPPRGLGSCLSEKVYANHG